MILRYGQETDVQQNYNNNIIINSIFDSYLVWRMQLKIIEGKNSCCVCREFFTFNAYKLNLSYQILVKFIFVY